MNGLYVIYSDDKRHILGVSRISGVALTQEEDRFYEKFVEAVRDKPESNVSDFHLRSDFTWEERPIDTEDEEQELSAEETLNILLGGADA